MTKDEKDGLIVVASGAAGAARGGGVLATVGGMGLAAAGGAIALPVVAIGTGLGLILGVVRAWQADW